MGHKTKWDMLTRILHWTTASLVIALFLSAAGMDLFEATFGKVAEIKLQYVHLYLGLALTASVSARVLWGFFGNVSVNWRGIPSGIAKYPGWVSAEIDYVFRRIDSDKRKKEGHNALAIPVYFFALTMILFQVATGLGMWDDLDKKAKKHGVVQAPTRPSTTALSNPMDTLIPIAFAHADHDDKREGRDSKVEEAKGEETAGSQATGEKAKGAEAVGVEAVGDKKKEETLGEEIHEFGLFWVPLYLALHLGGIFFHYRRGARDLIRGMTAGV